MVKYYERGSATAELVVIFPAFLFLVLIGMQIALVSYANATVRNAASEGEVLLRSPNSSPQQVADEITRYINTLSISDLENVRVTTTTGQFEKVSIGADVYSVVPFLKFRVFASGAGLIQEYR